MTYFADLSEYVYSTTGEVAARNIGWLAADREFDQADISEEILDVVWEYCRFSVVQTRGLHDCEFCPTRVSSVVERKGERLLLGSAEIRVFSKTGDAYAAPNLIYHYMSVHRYRAPEEFLNALKTGPRASSEEYLNCLVRSGLTWNRTSSPDEDPPRFRFAKAAGGVKKIVEL